MTGQQIIDAIMEEQRLIWCWRDHPRWADDAPERLVKILRRSLPCATPKCTERSELGSTRCANCITSDVLTKMQNNGHQGTELTH